MKADGPVDAGIYEPVITAVGNAGYEPLFVSYDWRLSSSLNSASLLEAIRSGKVSSPFVVVAHSLGGVIASLAYAAYQPTPSDPVWGQTVYVAVPFGGSFDAVATIAGVASPFAAYSLWYNSFGLLSNTGGLGQQQFAALSTRVKRVMASWPVLYELMPSSQPPWNALHGDTSAFYLSANWGVANPNVTQARLDAAVQVQREIASAYALPKPPSAYVVGGGLFTRAGLLPGAGFELSNGYVEQRIGDHVVPADFATLSGGEDLSIFGDHTDMLGQQPFLAQLPALLRGTQTLPMTIPEPFKQGVVPATPMTTMELPALQQPTLQRRGDP
jgi:pimeloyl-ACP methyl ester carboxylesterase